MILAEGAAQIAPVTAYREYLAARMEPLERFLLYRVKRDGGDPAVIIRPYHSAGADPRPAEALPSLINLAMMKTYVALCHGILPVRCV